MMKTELSNPTMVINVNEELIDETIDYLSDSLTEMIQAYEESNHTDVAYLLFTGNFKSRYDNVFSGLGCSLIPYSEDNDSLFSTIFNKIDKCADMVTFTIEDSTFNIRFDNHDGSTYVKLTLITKNFAKSHNLEDVWENYPRSLAVKKLMGTLKPKGTRITKKMTNLFF